MTTQGDHEARLWTQGHSEKLGALDVGAFTYFDLGEGESRLWFANSSKLAWDLRKTVAVSNWTEGKDGIGFDGLSAEQVARIGFLTEGGLYRAKLMDGGELRPDTLVEASDPPYDLSDVAREKRRAVYEIDALSELADMKGTVSFYGDSITWNNSFVPLIQKAAGEGLKTINHGVNGGGVLTLRDGDQGTAHFGNTKPEPMVATLAADKPDVAVVYIGINDIWWRETSEADFEKGLRDLVAVIRKASARPVLATLAVHDELPTGENVNDTKCDQYAEITRKVARETGAVLVDLRAVFMAYLKNKNVDLRVDGSLAFQKNGVLTGDGVHPNGTGTKLIAEHVTLGILKAMK